MTVEQCESISPGPGKAGFAAQSLIEVQATPLPVSSLQQRIDRKPFLLENTLQFFQGIHLNLAHSLARDTDLAPDLFQRGDLVTVQSEAAFHHCSLLVAQL